MNFRFNTKDCLCLQAIYTMTSKVNTYFFHQFKDDPIFGLLRKLAKNQTLNNFSRRYELTTYLLPKIGHGRKHSPQLILMLSIIGLANTAIAKPFLPDSADTVVAHWPRLESAAGKGQSGAEQDPKTALATAQAYLRQAMQLGQSNLYGLAQAVLTPIMAKNPADPQLWLTWAQILQHQHQFTQAEHALERVLAIEPQQVTANLLAARLALIRGQVQQAKRHCLRLLGHSELITISACSLEAASYDNAQALQASYNQLAKLAIELKDVGQENNWIHQILADMALRLGDAQSALTWLTPMPAQASVSQWSQWADAQLALHGEREILHTLGTQVQSLSDQDDALLVRLALAEKRLANQEPQWQQLITAKIRLREARGDTQHAADLCLFYLDIQPNAQKALAWAQLNWQQAQEPADQKLLARAQALNLLQAD